MSNCSICKRVLDAPGEPDSKDCGGDCLKCMAVIGQDPDCVDAMMDLGGGYAAAVAHLVHGED